MSKSVLNEYYKLAVKQGLIKEAKTSYETLTENPRVGSDDIETIEKLYSIKRKDIDGKEVKKTWIEEAHPESVVRFRAHDKLNGLLENDEERQLITLHQLRKRDVSLAKLKVDASYSILLRNLLSVASKLEDKNDQLRKLADSCSDNLIKSTIKQAAAPALLIGLAVALPLIVGSGVSHMKPLVNNLNEATEKLSADLKDIYDSETVLGFDYEYSDSFKEDARKIDKASLAVNSLANKLLSGLEHFSEEKKQKTAELYQAFLQASEKITNKFKEKVSQFKDPYFKQSVIKQTGSAQKLLDQVPYLHNPTSNAFALFTSDFDELLQSFEAFIGQLDALKTKLQSLYEDAKQQAEEPHNEEVVKQEVKPSVVYKDTKTPANFEQIVSQTPKQPTQPTKTMSDEEEFRKIFRSK